jgi:hypothetical protein
MPRLTYSTDEAHALLTQADHTAAAGQDPALADLYRTLATEGLDLEACTPDEDLRAQLGMPPLTAGPEQASDGGDHPRVA